MTISLQDDPKPDGDAVTPGTPRTERWVQCIFITQGGGDSAVFVDPVAGVGLVVVPSEDIFGGSRLVEAGDDIWVRAVPTVDADEPEWEDLYKIGSEAFSIGEHALCDDPATAAFRDGRFGRELRLPRRLRFTPGEFATIVAAVVAGQPDVRSTSAGPRDAAAAHQRITQVVADTLAAADDVLAGRGPHRFNQALG